MSQPSQPLHLKTKIKLEALNPNQEGVSFYNALKCVQAART